MIPYLDFKNPYRTLLERKETVKIINGNKILFEFHFYVIVTLPGLKNCCKTISKFLYLKSFQVNFVLPYTLETAENKCFHGV